MSFLRRLLGVAERDPGPPSEPADPVVMPAVETPGAETAEPGVMPAVEAARAETVEPAATPAPAATPTSAATPASATPRPARSLACPYCGWLLDPPPVRNRRCPGCREPIVVRHLDGRVVLLVESAVAVFDRERQRVVDEATWTVERDRWLRLAAGVHAPAIRLERLAEAHVSAEVVHASRSLYLSNAETSVRLARRSMHWPEIARIRRQQAAALHHEAGSPVPPSDSIAALHRDGMLAELHALSVAYADAELVSTGCCRACRADDGRVFDIKAELRQRRLPHEGCPKGLCPCEWWLAMPTRKKTRRPAKRGAAPTIDLPATSSEGESGETDVTRQGS